MRRSSLSVVAAVAALALVGTMLFASTASANRHVLSARLSGGQQGDPNGRGTAIVTINRRRSRVCFALSWRGVGRVNSAHIHTRAGDIVVPFFDNLGLPPNIRAIGGCARAEGALIGRISRRPGRYYVNIHTPQFEAGAIRGWLRRP